MAIQTVIKIEVSLFVRKSTCIKALDQGNIGYYQKYFKLMKETN